MRTLTVYVGIVGILTSQSLSARPATKSKQLSTPSDVQIYNLLPRKIQMATLVFQTKYEYLPNGGIRKVKATPEDSLEKIRDDLDNDGYNEVVVKTSGSRGHYPVYLCLLRQKNNRWIFGCFIEIPESTYSFWQSPRPTIKVVPGVRTKVIVVSVRQERNLPLQTFYYVYNGSRLQKTDSSSLASIQNTIHDFKLFLAKFKKILISRDKKALREVMIREFLYTFGYPGEGDLRVYALRNWGDQDWKELTGLVNSGRYEYKKEQVAIHPRKATDRRAYFEKQKGSWKFTGFVAGD